MLFKDVDALEPHIVTFGPMALLKQLSHDFVTPMPQKNGPPVLAINAKAFKPTMGHIYDGTGYANSGFLRSGQSWSLTFTKPGMYKYYCLLHPGMDGTITVMP